MHINKKSQTTSTKCQYQALASKPKWCPPEKCAFMCRPHITAMKIVPIITWRPWKPVATKNVLPYTESDMENELKTYSIACSTVKNRPRPTVQAKLIWASIHFEPITAMCAQVIVAPLDNSTVVFSRGTSKGLIATTPEGGHTVPISTLGLNEEWKNAQKNAKKKQISLVIKRIIPIRIPSSTLLVCFPWKVASRLTSRHHWAIVIKMINSPILPRIRKVSNLCIHPARPATKKKAPAAPVKGQGLASTIWNGCFVILLFHKKLFCKLYWCWKQGVIIILFLSIKSWTLTLYD